MEGIKLPKFKTKEELEQFAMGLMTENESLRDIIKRKDSSITELRNDAHRVTNESYKTGLTLEIIKMENIRLKDKIKALEYQAKHMKEENHDDKYKELYERECEYHGETIKKAMDYQHKFEESKKMVHKLLTLVIFMYGLLNRFQAKRVYDAYGEFNAAEYRL